MSSQPTEPVLACNISGIPQEFRQSYRAAVEHIFASTQEVRELATGYAWRLRNETEIVQSLVTFLSYERLCCPFFHFTLEIEPAQGPIWLQITGTSDVRAFIQSEGWGVPDKKG
ncbi:hypothetical protein [Dictyobacter aurantiacus]|uniref:Uncharacterized protein n=1 Tax=Dictyobacter aurantiacus TaxID=1936993 RepID=A0A401ZK99_9CHLR|nr:hypothetical protein [Dictyobacter aurantiacus]GCE07250.1 hypothetical protein KDAU_45790 [Dictyobacter aurantiacus]